MINPTALVKIVHYLGLQSFQVSNVVRCEEWKNVYFVQLKGHRPTFYSKKMVNRAQFIKNGYCAGGDALIVDTKTDKVYITRKPGWDAGSEYAFKELSCVPSQWATFDGCQKYQDKFNYRYDATKNPKTLRDLYIYLSIRRHDQVMEQMEAA